MLVFFYLVPYPHHVPLALTLENIDTVTPSLCRNLEPDKPEGKARCLRYNGKGPNPKFEKMSSSRFLLMMVSKFVSDLFRAHIDRGPVTSNHPRSVRPGEGGLQ
jgi:hypothetical protein